MAKKNRREGIYKGAKTPIGEVKMVAEGLMGGRMG